MRALKKEVHRQMQIHGDYKVGEKVIKVDIAVDIKFSISGLVPQRGHCQVC